MGVSTLVPDKCVEPEGIDVHHVHDGVPQIIEKEWKGTRLHWQIQPDPAGARIRLTREGLSPSLECYDISQQGWDHFFMHSQKEHLDRRR
jgi:hypothetical protein